MGTRPDLATLLARAARDINAPGDLDSTLAAVVDFLTSCLPAGHHVGVTLLRRDAAETRAASDDLVAELDHAQHELGEGPGIDALAADPVVCVDRIARDQRWPAYVPVAVGHGVLAQVAVRLCVEERTWGAINLYLTEADTVDPDLVLMLTLLASHAAVAVERSTREDNLKAALRTRKLIGQAVGVAMERFELDEEMAFRYLVRLSSSRNVKLRDIARELVSEANARPRGAGRPGNGPADGPSA